MKKKLTVEEIHQIITEEFEATKQSILEKSKNESESQTYLAFQVVNHFVKKIIDEPIPYFFHSKDAETLANIIKRAEFDNYYAHLIYKHIVIELRGKLSNLEENSKDYENLYHAIEGVEIYAFKFFGEYLEEVFKDVHIATILFTVKKHLAILDKSRYEYLREALLNIKKDVELRIRLRKEEKRNRDEMFEPPDDENIGILNNELIGSDKLTKDRAILFMDYLFRFAKTSNFNTDKAKVISLLTGYSQESVRQRLSTIHNEKGNRKKQSKTNKEDLRIVNHLFRVLGLNEISQEIETKLK